MTISERFQQLAKLIALGDTVEASVELDMIAREVRAELDEEIQLCDLFEYIERGRAEAATALRRAGRAAA